MFTRWDPDVMVDTPTSDGADYSAVNCSERTATRL
jgi:hypothetical protein